MKDILERLRTVEPCYSASFCVPIVVLTVEERDSLVKEYDKVCKLIEELKNLSINK